MILIFYLLKGDNRVQGFQGVRLLQSLGVVICQEPALLFRRCVIRLDFPAHLRKLQGFYRGYLGVIEG